MTIEEAEFVAAIRAPLSSPPRDNRSAQIAKTNPLRASRAVVRRSGEGPRCHKFHFTDVKNAKTNPLRRRSRHENYETKPNYPMNSRRFGKETAGITHRRMLGKRRNKAIASGGPEAWRRTSTTILEIAETNPPRGCSIGKITKRSQMIEENRAVFSDRCAVSLPKVQKQTH